MKRYGETREKASHNALQLMEHLVNLEKNFFKQIGVNELVCRVGKHAPYNVPNYYFLGPGDMQRFGLKNVQVMDGYAETDTSRLPYSIRFLRLIR